LTTIRPGFLDAHLSRRNLNEKAELLVLTKWPSVEAIRAVTALVHFDDRVQHWFSTARRLKTSKIEPRACP
jgi:hypothetical protein